jgi:hypothetical protein
MSRELPSLEECGDTPECLCRVNCELPRNLCDVLASSIALDQLPRPTREGSPVGRIDDDCLLLPEPVCIPLALEELGVR